MYKINQLSLADHYELQIDRAPALAIRRCYFTFDSHHEKAINQKSQNAGAKATATKEHFAVLTLAELSVLWVKSLAVVFAYFQLVLLSLVACRRQKRRLLWAVRHELACHKRRSGRLLNLHRSLEVRHFNNSHPYKPAFCRPALFQSKLVRPVCVFSFAGHPKSSINPSSKCWTSTAGFKKRLFNRVHAVGGLLEPVYNRRKHGHNNEKLIKNEFRKLSNTVGYIGKPTFRFWLASILHRCYASSIEQDVTVGDLSRQLVQMPSKVTGFIKSHHKLSICPPKPSAERSLQSKGRFGPEGFHYKSLDVDNCRSYLGGKPIALLADTVETLPAVALWRSSRAGIRYAKQQINHGAANKAKTSFVRGSSILLSSLRFKLKQKRSERDLGVVKSLKKINWQGQNKYGVKWLRSARAFRL